MAIYDFNTINTVIPIEDVLAFHGIEPNGKAGDQICCKGYIL